MVICTPTGVWYVDRYISKEYYIRSKLTVIAAYTLTYAFHDFCFICTAVQKTVMPEGVFFDSSTDVGGQRSISFVKFAPAYK